ncbi:uncharacterized protein STEHIDRAFT_140990 [Stereum hirsutum FP-91666 SS1]|uniref:uncharacterized protein n=1 Tax=Stereum hirsutum (strain FP-91666) TaxID=721885 RepID=UPI0004449EC9|nr:uncharacterized protein STEHIDRAFT_140990 [Stereum hirsutum FP-91666 SS1]EIM84073.1 hypothetical protein STEHIDRAFT_140990 [Stereum hirsutum FP-91666 SS1]
MLSGENPKRRERPAPIHMPELPKPGPYRLPGYGLPVNFEPQPSHKVHRSLGPPTYQYQEVHYPQQGDGDTLFRNALRGGDTLCFRTSTTLLTLREITMMRLMNQLTDKPLWEEKVFDDNITAKWKAEALATPEIDITELMVDYCIVELRWKTELFKKHGFVIAFEGDVVKSDSAISPKLKDELKAAVISLENVPDKYKDWHPGSDEKVLDLVHPSLFPLVYGKTRILPDSTCGLDDCIRRCGEGVVLPAPSKEECEFIRDDLYGRGHYYSDRHPTPWSRNYQWLPCQVKLTDGVAKITSYINNLHPQHNKGLYSVVEQVITRTVPLWNRTLTALQADGGRGELNPARIPTYNGPSYGDEEEPEMEEGEDDGDYSDRLRAWRRSNVLKPEPVIFDALEFEEKAGVVLETDFAEKGLQVIVKLANIQLTPEKPTYDGGSWHVEGQLNEHICATAIYYYDCENITDSHLSFRQQSDADTMDYNYGQDDHEWLQVVFGCQNGESSVQELGDVLTKEGRLITFPNILQHCVQPFRLADPTKPGHRKILALFLVDPHIQIISTQNVPTQRRDWWTEELQSTKSFGKLPIEVGMQIGNLVDDWPIGMEEAKKMREELMDERRAFVDNNNFWFSSTTFSLCEH